MTASGLRRDSDTALWKARDGHVEVRFTGRLADASRAGALATACAGALATACAGASPPRLAWAKQVHGATVLTAGLGLCGEGDALVTRERGLALAIATADCVPIVLAGGGAQAEIAAIHAGWRGIAANVVAATLLRMQSPAAQVRCWIGPAIGQCCYEVSEEVAQSVAAASTPEAIARRAGAERPHLDLHGAVTAQLRALGVVDVGRTTECTRCCSESLWSYRRDGSSALRNYAFIWLASE